MTHLADLSIIADPVARAEAANDLLWDGYPNTQRLLRARGEAIRDAINQGRSAGEIADHLHVRADDLTWMSRPAQASR